MQKKKIEIITLLKSDEKCLQTHEPHIHNQILNEN